MIDPADPKYVEFWDHVNIRGKNDCWEYKRAKHKQGYGWFKHQLAHRVAYSLNKNKKLFANNIIRHKCDNPPCCNPRHLRNGSQGDNVRDMARKGRHVGSTKLTQEQVIKIYNSRKILTKLATKFNTDIGTISKIHTRKIFNKYTKNLPDRPKIFRKNKLLKKQILKIYRSKKSNSLLAKQYSVHVDIIWKIKSGRMHWNVTGATPIRRASQR
jgi:hypothetical protein